jgi:hypothetical protein
VTSTALSPEPTIKILGRSLSIIFAIAISAVKYDEEWANRSAGADCHSLGMNGSHPADKTTFVALYFRLGVTI